jgi:tRNA(Arg) A34 adenosine deaminase TadA
MQNNDKKFLSRAIELALEGMKNGGGPFGALIVHDGKKIAEAYNRVVPDHDPTAHAEIIAIREAAGRMKTHDLHDCILYTTCEPCPMCLGAIYWSGIRKVFYSCSRKDAEVSGFDDKMIYDEIALDPPERKVSFIRLEDCGAKEIFKIWDKLEDKTPY